MMSAMETKNISLLDLHWDDILFSHLFIHLDTQDCFNLRSVSKPYQDLVDSYFTKVKRIDITSFKAFNSTYFGILVAKCQNIRYLNLSKSKWLTNESIEKIFENNRLLTDVILNDCLNLQSSCLQPLILHCKDLKNLQLQHCFWVTSSCLDTLSLHQRHLEQVDFTSCWNLSDETLEGFLQTSTQLKILTISNVYAITDKTLFLIARSCQLLVHLSLVGCYKITDSGIRMIGNNCLQLKSLSVSDCKYVTERSLATLRPRMAIDKGYCRNMFDLAGMEALRRSLQV